MVHIIGIGQLRSYTRSYVERVQAGETFEVLRRGRAIARLEAVGAARAENDPALIPVPLAELRTRPARVLDRLAAGSTVLITYQGRDVAVLRPCDGADAARPARVPAGRAEPVTTGS